MSIAFLAITKFSLIEIKDLFKFKNKIVFKNAIDRLSEKDSKKVNSFVHMIDEMLDVLGSGLIYSDYALISIIVGFCFGVVGVLLKNIMLAIMLFVSSQVLCFQILKYCYYRKTNFINKNLNLALSLITNTYLQNHDLIKSIKSNTYKLPESIREVFVDFLVRIEMVDPDIEKGVEILKGKINNVHFKRWCDLVIQCVNDRDYIKVLPAVVAEMANERERWNEYENIVNEAYKESLQLLVITALTPFMLKIIFPELLYYLLNTFFGKLILSFSYTVTLVIFGKVLVMNKPVGFR